mgnify:CR=1 FL=1
MFLNSKLLILDQFKRKQFIAPDTLARGDIAAEKIYMFRDKLGLEFFTAYR